MLSAGQTIPQLRVLLFIHTASQSSSCCKATSPLTTSLLFPWKPFNPLRNILTFNECFRSNRGFQKCDSRPRSKWETIHIIYIFFPLYHLFFSKTSNQLCYKNDNLDWSMHLRDVAQIFSSLRYYSHSSRIIGTLTYCQRATGHLLSSLLIIPSRLI